MNSSSSALCTVNAVICLVCDVGALGDRLSAFSECNVRVCHCVFVLMKPSLTIHSFKSNQIKSLLLSHHHSTSALVSEILMSVLQTVQKKQTTIYIWTDSAKKTNNNLHMDRQCKKNNKQFTYGQTVQKKLHWSIYRATERAVCGTGGWSLW